MHDNAPDFWLSTSQLAKRYGVHRDTVYGWIVAGIETPYGKLRLNSLRVGGNWKATAKDAETYFEALSGDKPAIALVRQWKCNGGHGPTPVSETPAAAHRRARADQERVRQMLHGKGGAA